MKTRKLIFAGVLFSGLACLIGMVSCNSQPTEETARAAVEKKGGMVVTTEVAQPEATEAVAAVQRTRLDRFGAKKAFVKVTDDNKIIAIIPEVQEPERVRRLLQADGRLGFWETYELFEIKESLLQVNEALDTTIFDFITLGGPEGGLHGPEVALRPLEDTAGINAVLASETAKHILPRDARLVWSAKPVREDAPYYHLVALKAMRNGRAALGGEVITAAKVEHNKWSPEPVIDLSMNAEGAKCWQYLTRDNVGKSIGIVVDGQLYSYPTVMCEIECGRSQITGNFTEEEAADMANLLNSGVMPCPVRIIEEQIIEPQK